MQLEKVSYGNFEDRISRMKQKVISQPHEICVERAVLFTGSYKETKGEPPVIRFAKAMEHLLNNMTLMIWDDEYIVGNRCTKYVGTPLYPEVRIDAVESDIDIYDTRKVQKFLLTDDERDIIRNQIISYWKDEDETAQERFMKYVFKENSSLIQRMID